MSNASDYVIEDGVLKKYKGSGEYVVVPEGVTSIGGGAFWGCTNLTNISLPDSVTSIGDGAFSHCANLTNITLPECVMKIGDSVFRGCERLTSITLPESVTSIGDRAFEGCERLTSIMLPEGLTSIGDRAFMDCKSLADEQGMVIIRGVLYGYYGSGGNVVVPEGVTSIGDWAFRDCASLTSITMPEGVTSIGDMAFYLCTSLTSVTLPKSLTSIGDRAFEGCESLTSITMPEGVTNIGEEAFRWCKSLVCVSLPGRLINSLRSSQFLRCEQLKTFCFNTEPIIGSEKLPLFLANRNVEFSEENQARIVVFQNAKAWQEWLRTGNVKNAGAVMTYVLKLLSEMEMIGKAEGAQAMDFTRDFVSDIQLEQRQLLTRLLEEKGYEGLETLRAVDDYEKLFCEEEQAAQPQKDHPIEAEARQLLAGLGVVPEAEKAVIRGLPYADGSGVSSRKVVLCVIAAYVQEFYRCADKVSDTTILTLSPWKPAAPQKVADRIAAELDRTALSNLLEALLKKPTYRPYVLAWARFATEESVARFAADYSKLSKGRAKERYKAENLSAALLLSDTRQAMMLMDKIGYLDSYAKMRGTDEETLRNTVLFDLGFDENGQMRFDLGNTIVTATLNPDLTLSLYDEGAGKIVKSLPKKGANPDKHATADKSYKEIKSNVKKLAKMQNDRLFIAFLNGKVFDAQGWRDVYCKKPLLRQVASLLVWEQDCVTFTLSGRNAVDASGTAVDLTDAKIRLAHPMEMTAQDISNWQRYFNTRDLKQPFAQVWEPFRRAEEIKPDRYMGYTIPINFFRGAEKHGISLSYEFESSEVDIHVAECMVEYETNGDFYHNFDANGTVEITDFTFQNYSRQINHIVALLDRWTVRGRILKDDASIADILPGFTLAQITEFLILATENNAVSCTALLLNYKNEHFSDYDPMEEFTLEW